MRSSPLLLLVLVVLGFAAVAVPLTRLTEARPGAAAVQPARAEAALVQTHIRVRFAHTPVRISLRQADRLIADIMEPAQSPVEVSESIDLSGRGAELMVEAAWPPGTPDTALMVELEPDGFETRSATRWTDTASLTELLSFYWP